MRIPLVLAQMYQTTRVTVDWVGVGIVGLVAVVIAAGVTVVILKRRNAPK